MPLLALPSLCPVSQAPCPLGAECFSSQGTGLPGFESGEQGQVWEKASSLALGRRGHEVPTGWVSGGSVCLAMHMLGEGVNPWGR